MADSRNSKNGNNDALWLLIPLVILMFAVFWFVFHSYLSELYIYMRYVELVIPAAIGSIIHLPVFNEAREWVNYYCQPQGWGVFGICTRDFSTVEMKDIIKSTMIINFIFIAPTIYIAIKSYIKIDKKHPKRLFRKEHNIHSFMMEKQHEYKHLKMFVNIDMISKDLDDPLFGMPLSSREFVRINNLIEGWQKNQDGKTFTPTLDIKKTRDVFIEQMGKLWTGNNFMELSVSEILMMAITVPLVAATDSSLSDEEFKIIKKDSSKIINFCWDQFIPPPHKKGKEESYEPPPHKKGKEESYEPPPHKKGKEESYEPPPHKKGKEESYEWLKPDIDITESRKIIIKYYKKSEQVRNIFKKHAYVSTIIYGLFYEARRLGVLQAAEVRWLRFFDRRMFIIIENIGRPSAFPEGCAVHGHFLFETKMGTAYSEPLIVKAIEGLQNSIQSYKYEESHVAKYSS
jgi:intracellular multiplication protein IcmP